MSKDTLPRTKPKGRFAVTDDFLIKRFTQLCPACNGNGTVFQEAKLVTGPRYSGNYRCGDCKWTGRVPRAWVGPILRWFQSWSHS